MRNWLTVLGLGLGCVLALSGVALADYVNGVQAGGDFGELPGYPTDNPAYRARTAVLIDFDDVTAPCAFSQANPLRDEYLGVGVSFAGLAPLDGGAVLNECGGFVVTGYSAPNFLAFNSSAIMANGGWATLPETATFTAPVFHVSCLVGAGSGHTLTLTALDGSGAMVDESAVDLATEMQVISVDGCGIMSVTFESTSSIVIIDDFGFDVGPSATDDETWSGVKALYR
jgi:hypothetical protein